MAVNLSPWPEDDLRSAFLAGAKFWEFHQTGGTMWQSDQNEVGLKAEERYPDGKPIRTDGAAPL